MLDFLSSSDFWVLVSFLGLIGLVLYFRVPALAAAWLDARGAAIGKEIEEAEAILRDAKKLLADNKARASDIDRETAAILAAATADAKRDIEAREAAMKDTLARAEDAMKARIAQSQQAMLEQVRREAAALALKAARQLLAEKMKSGEAAETAFARELSAATQAVEKHH